MIVMIDNYDSFTYNLFQYFKQLDEDVTVFRNDQVTIAEIEGLDAELIVISPGPGHPADTGICREVLSHFFRTTPILGICLGHQMIVEFFGGKIEKGVRPVHGKVSAVTHDGKSVFHKLPCSLKVTRYHSLQTPAEELPLMLEISSMTEDSVVMGVRHHIYPVEGIQFHPESILTECGFQMLENAYKQALAFREKREKGVMI
ncbi:aminodeoxychorismate/anthranilate synthase component II [Halobacillus shinanisalinarum]|uniref:Aminodeoxychorismate/anthranilate synthase component II n=1 Tax=Halobacillus shinanisalinarum TaxID=2932258 RepID=A0ABY4H8G9_9BACI|nr:aminodeoxychorismate/anthranilate synthase component II [Halobacillus shinanisalinarum]UOQ95272.1 aminodeoxychorismate/anthranilate synthase component II [Halobacillus shinanisalinarum]